MKVTYINADDNRILIAKEIIKKYRNNVILNNNEILEICSGDRIGLIGPSGSGKTTLCEILAFLRKPNYGKIYIKDNLKISIQFQENNFSKDCKFIDLINLYADNFLIDLSYEQLEKKLSELDINYLLNKTMNLLTNSEKQRVNIFLATLIDPDLLILDELTTGIEGASQIILYRFLKKFLKDKKKTLLFVSHDMKNLQKIVNKIWLIYNGKIIDKLDLSSILKNYNSLEEFVFKKISIYNPRELMKKRKVKEESEKTKKIREKWDINNQKRRIKKNKS